MDRTNHYETAFESYLLWHGLGYIAVDETRRALFGDTPVKSLDFVVFGDNGNRLVIDVKGRRFPGGKPGKLRRVWENWSTQEDVASLTRHGLRRKSRPRLCGCLRVRLPPAAHRRGARRHCGPVDLAGAPLPAAGRRRRGLSETPARPQPAGTGHRLAAGKPTASANSSSRSTISRTTYPPSPPIGSDRHEAPHARCPPRIAEPATASAALTQAGRMGVAEACRWTHGRRPVPDGTVPDGTARIP